MPPWVPDAVTVFLILGMTYALASEGAWGSALMFFNVLFAGLIAFNFYEPLAAKLAEASSSFANWADLLCLAGLFILTLIIFRVITDMIAPAMVRLPTPAYQLGRLVFASATACMTAAILICILEVAPVHRKILGSIDYQAQPPFGQGFDRKWLGFVQHATENVFPSYGGGDDESGAGDMANAFDRRASWLMDHQNARPYHSESGPDTVPEPESAPAAVAAPAAAGAPEGGGGRGGRGGPGG